MISACKGSAPAIKRVSSPVSSLQAFRTDFHLNYFYWHHFAASPSLEKQLGGVDYAAFSTLYFGARR